MDLEAVLIDRKKHAEIIAKSGGFETAKNSGTLPYRVNTSLSEALVMGLLRQGVRTFFAVFGHGSTEVGEVLRIYQDAGLVRVLGVRNEIEASHAASALRWVTGQKAAVITSIGPGAMQALAASLVPASDGIGVWYLFGDETSEDEGFNMQQIPKNEQGLFLKLCATMGAAYSLHTPRALSTALRRGAAVVDHPYRPGPFFLLLPMNIQPMPIMDFNLDELPTALSISIGPAVGDYQKAALLIHQAEKVVVKVGGGALHAGSEVSELLDLADGLLVHTPLATGIIPYAHPRNMGVGGSKGTLCGNYVMENADLLVAIGTRAVCQSDCSRTGYPNVKQVININANLEDGIHYAKTLALIGEVVSTLQHLNTSLRLFPQKISGPVSNWMKIGVEKKCAWQAHKSKRYDAPRIYDEYWKKDVLTQPAVIKTATDWARKNNVVTFFDAGDVQANGFQIVEDDQPGCTFTETGASYMGFAPSALLATAAAQKPFYGLVITGDGSFVMNPQILIDGVEHKAHGCLLVLDNGRMGAISGLQRAQYGAEFATHNSVHVDYLAWGRGVPGIKTLDGGYSPKELHFALEQAYAHPGMSLVLVKVYFGENELGGMGVFGRWNVGPWCEETQDLRHHIGL